MPEILVAIAKTMYLQTDFGDVSLFDIIKEGYTERVKQLYRKAFEQLAQLQVKAVKG